MGHNTDVNVQADAIQSDDVEIQATETLGGETELNSPEPQPEPKPLPGLEPEPEVLPNFIDERQKRANEMVEKQRQERNQDIASELGLDRHPDYEHKSEKKENSEEEIKINSELQEETINNEEEEEDPQNIVEDPKSDNINIDEPPQDIDQTRDNDLKLNKPGFYGDEVVLKIDGKLEKMPAEKALSILQKNQTADKRLENIVLRERQLTQREQQLQQQQHRPQPSEPKTPDVVEDADIEKRARTIVQSVEDGEQEVAVETLVALVKDTVGRQPVQAEPTLTPDQITQLVDQRSKAMEATTVESRLKASGDYEDVFNDQTAYGLAISNVNNLVASGFEGSTEQLMTEAMEMVRDWRTGLSRELRLEQQARALEPEPEPKPKPKKAHPEISEPQRLEKKRDSSRPVKSTTTIQRPAQAAPEPEPSAIDKRRSIFNEVKAARGQ